MPSQLRFLTAALAVLFFVLHLYALPRSLEDIDSVNFALGVESFDVAAHRPHPPGYPVFIGMAKASTHLVGLLAPDMGRDERAAVGLAIWSVLAGSIAAFVLLEFWLALGLPPRLAWPAMALAIVSPVFWLTSARPLTDTPGLAAALLVQTVIFRGWRRWAAGETGPREWVLAALLAGFIIGVRSQTLWLTAPLLTAAVIGLAARGQLRFAARVVFAAAAGALLWAVPLVWSSGGLGRYLAALGGQGAEDFEGVWMFAVRPSVRLLAQALDATFLIPWHAPVLGAVVTLLALVGLTRASRRHRPMLAAIVLGFAPYLLFHIAFHETAEIRYALPLVVPVAGMAIVGLATFGSRVPAVGGAVLCGAALVIAQPALAAYAAAPAPVFRAFQDMQRAMPSGGAPPALQMHHQVWWGVRRVTDWYRAYWDPGPQPFPGDREWLSIVSRWQAGQTPPVWLLADLKRSDTRVFDPRTRTLVGRYAWPPEADRLIGGSRLRSLALWRLDRPGWMLGEGWSITPEVAGMTFEDEHNPQQQPAEAFIARGPEARRVMIGGRYLAGSVPGIVIVSLDGREIRRVTVDGDPNWFLEWIDLPAGSLDGASGFATLQVRVIAAQEGAPPPWIGLEQFDAASLTEPMFGFDRGWQELEENPSTGLLWRWSSARSTVTGYTGGRDLTLVIAGENPLKYFDRPPMITVKAGERELARFSPEADFEERVPVPGGVFGGARGEIHIETDRTFVPGASGSSPDQRQLGLRLYRVEAAR